MIPQLHQNFLDNALQVLKQDTRIDGVAIGGSYIYNNMDEYSDLDLVVVTRIKAFEQVMSERKAIAESLGQLLSCFTGEHVGEPRLLICLYGPELLHVDLKFVSLEDVESRVEDPVILWERDNKISERFRLKAAKFPYPELQWMEDRFWTWVHYGATKLGRKEIFDAISLINHLRNTVVGPLTLMKNNKLPRGVRKLEVDAAKDLPQLILTVPNYEFDSCVSALRALIAIYQELRSILADSSLVLRSDAERLSIQYLDAVVEQNK